MGRAETTRRSRRACCGHGRRKGRRCCGRCRWAPASAVPPSVAGTCICWTGTRRSGDTLRVLDLASGKELWTFAYDARRQLHVRRLPHDADRGWRARLHRRTDGRSARDQHEDPQARLAQEHLEGLRRRRRAAAVGDRPESVDLRRPADRRAADRRGRRRGLRQADRHLKWKSAALSGIPGIRDALDRQGGRGGSTRHDHRRRRSRPQRQGRQRQRSGSAQRQGAVDLHRLAVHHPGPAGGRRR